MRVLLAALASLFISGCSTTMFFDNFGSLFVTEESRKAKTTPSVPFQSLVRTGSGSTLAEGFTTVIRSQEDLDLLLASHRDLILAAYQLESKLPLDFSRQQGLFLLDHPHADGGASIEIVAIEETPDRFIVHSIRWRARPGQKVSLMVQQPVQYVSMARSEKPVEFAAPVEAYEKSL